MSQQQDDDGTTLDGATNIFEDTGDFYPVEKQPTFAEHQMLSGETIRVRLVGSHPLYVCDDCY